MHLHLIKFQDKIKKMNSIYFTFFFLVLFEFGKCLTVSYSMVVDRISIGISYDDNLSFVFYTSIDMQDPHTFLSYSKGKKISDEIISHEERYFNTTIRSNKIVIDKKITFQCTYFNLHNGTNFFGLEKGIGTGITQNNVKSLQMQLKDQGIIPYASIAIIPNKSQPNGEITFGGIEWKKIRGKYKGKCFSEKKWGCRLQSVDFLGLNLNANEYVHFQSSGGYILAPPDFWVLLEDIVFANAGEHCTKKDSNLFYYSFICDKEVFKIFPSIKFDFWDIKFILSNDLLFDKSGEDYLFKILRSPNAHWIFGSQFLLNYITEFNEEDHSVTFYSDTPFDYIEKGSYRKMEVLFICIFVLCAIGIFVIFKRRKE